MPSAIYREVKQFQEELHKAGVYTGEITGRYDRATHEAVRALMASGKLGDPVPVPDPAEDTYGSVIAAVAEEMKFSPTAAESIRTAYSEFAREIQAASAGPTASSVRSRPQVLEDIGQVGAFRPRGFAPGTRVGNGVNGVQELKKRLTAWGFFRGPIDNNYGVLLEQSLQKFAKSKNTTVEKLLSGGAESGYLQMTPAAITEVRSARQAAAQAVASAVRSLGPQGQAVLLLQLTLKKAGLYTGPTDGKYSAAVEAAFQQWASRNGTTVEAYLASPGQPAVKRAVASARAAAGFGSTGTAANDVSSQRAVYALQTLLKKAGYISGDPDGIYEVNLEMAFGNWAAAANTTIDEFLSTRPGPLKQGIKRARDAYLASGGQAYPTGIGQVTAEQPAQEKTVQQQQQQTEQETVPESALPSAPEIPEAAPETQAIVPVPTTVKTAARQRPVWQKWFIYGAIAAVVGGMLWWYWRRKTAAVMGIEDENTEYEDKTEGCPCTRGEETFVIDEKGVR